MPSQRPGRCHSSSWIDAAEVAVGGTLIGVAEPGRVARHALGGVRRRAHEAEVEQQHVLFGRVGLDRDGSRRTPARGSAARARRSRPGACADRAPAAPRLTPGKGRRVQRLPREQRPQRGLAGEQPVQQGGAGALEPEDEDGLADGLLARSPGAGRRDPRAAGDSPARARDSGAAAAGRAGGARASSSSDASSRRSGSRKDSSPKSCSPLCAPRRSDERCLVEPRPRRLRPACRPRHPVSASRTGSGNCGGWNPEAGAGVTPRAPRASRRASSAGDARRRGSSGSTSCPASGRRCRSSSRRPDPGAPPRSARCRPLGSAPCAC